MQNRFRLPARNIHACIYSSLCLWRPGPLKTKTSFPQQSCLIAASLAAKTSELSPAIYQCSIFHIDGLQVSPGLVKPEHCSFKQGWFSSTDVLCKFWFPPSKLFRILKRCIIIFPSSGVQQRKGWEMSSCSRCCQNSQQGSSHLFHGALTQCFLPSTVWVSNTESLQLSLHSQVHVNCPCPCLVGSAALPLCSKATAESWTMQDEGRSHHWTWLLNPQCLWWL